MQEFHEAESFFSKEEAQNNEVMSIMLQITTAALIVFIAATVLFIMQARAELDQAKGKLPLITGVIKDIMNSEKGELYRKWEQSVKGEQKQRLINELDKVETEYRVKTGLIMFSRHEEGGLRFITSGVFSEGKIASARFIEGCAFAKEKLPDQAGLRREWFVRVLSEAGMYVSISTLPGAEAPAADDAKVLPDENAQWLILEIEKRVKALCTDACSMQRSALAELMRHYQQKPSLLSGSKAYDAVKKFFDAEPGQRQMMAEQVRAALYQHAKHVFEEQGAALLNDV